MNKTPETELVDLQELRDTLLAQARTASSGRAARTVRGGDGLLRQTAIALLAGAELAEHDSPPEAVLQLLAGRVRLNGRERHWMVGAGQLVPIPPERHSVSALEDSVLLLTVRRESPEPHAR